jgi:hypothetical protein
MARAPAPLARAPTPPTRAPAPLARAPAPLVRWAPCVWLVLLSLWCPSAAGGSVVLLDGGAEVMRDVQQRCRAIGAAAWELEGIELLRFDAGDAELLQRAGRGALPALSEKFGESVLVATDFSIFDAFEATLLGEMQFEELLCSIQHRGVIFVTSSPFLLISTYPYVMPWWPAGGARPVSCNYSMGLGDAASLEALFAAHNGSLLANASSSPNRWAPFLETTEWPWFCLRIFPAAVLVAIILYALAVAGLLRTRPSPKSAVVRLILLANIAMLSTQLAIALFAGGIWGFLSEDMREPWAVASIFFMSGPGAGLSLLLGLYIDKMLASTRHLRTGLAVLGVMFVLDIVNDYYIYSKTAPYVVYYVTLPALQLFFLLGSGAFLAKRLVALQAQMRTRSSDALDATTTRIRRRLLASGTLSLVGITFTLAAFVVLQLGFCATPHDFVAFAVVLFLGRCAVATAQILFCDERATFCTGLRLRRYSVSAAPSVSPASARSMLSPVAAAVSVLGASQLAADKRAAKPVLIRGPSKDAYSFGGHE